MKRSRLFVLSVDMSSLLVDWCSYEAAKYAVEHWHYSGTMPVGKLVKIGIWEDGDFIGSVIFGNGANNHIGSPYELTQQEICELVRIALRVHKTPVSMIASKSVRMLAISNPGIRLLVSYADPKQKHVGIIYQAMNWIYTGTSQPQRETLGNGGEIVHKRTQHSRYGTIKGLPKSEILWKHKYLYPLDKAMRRQILPLAQPYPKRGQGVNGDTPTVQVGEAGSIPAVRSNMTGQEPELVE